MPNTLFEAMAYGYDKAALVTINEVRRINRRVLKNGVLLVSES
jgi:hypothetical protein